MRYVDIYDAKPGMKVATEVLDAFGRVLISADIQVTAAYIEKLHELGICGIYIDDAWSEGIEITPPISPVLRSQGMAAVANMDIDSCHDVAKEIVRQILENGSHTINMMDLRSYDNYTYAHSVNVAVLSCTIGFGMDLSEDELVDLVFAALLHDMGKMDIPEEVINKPERLTPEEYALVKSHPQSSYNYIYDRVDISSFVKNAVLCHHENYDGSGYPNGLAEKEISPLARIIHVADVYDALVSKRPYKNPYSPYIAVEIIEKDAGSLFDPKVVEAFRRYVPVFPKGTEVLLRDGTKAIILQNSSEHTLHPVIRLEDMTEIDLSKEENADITIGSPSQEEYHYMLIEERHRNNMTVDVKRYKIIVLDKNGESFEKVNERLGYLYDFRLAQSENQAKGYYLKYGKPDMIIVDIDDRDLDNFTQFAQENKAVAQQMPVIILGSYSDMPAINQFRELGISNYVLKPFKSAYLLLEIQRCAKEFGLD